MKPTGDVHGTNGSVSTRQVALTSMSENSKVAEVEDTEPVGPESMVGTLGGVASTFHVRSAPTGSVLP